MYQKMRTRKPSGERWLITGGLGYIGSHVTRDFILGGYEVFIVDNLSTGIIARLPEEATFFECDIRSSDLIHEICNKFEIVGIVHMAAFKHARESKLDPSKYFANNIGGTLGLIEALKGTAVKKVIFSSSCSIYGDAAAVNETSFPGPKSPYADSKLISEKLLEDSLGSFDIDYTALRFFNVIGCSDFPDSRDQSQECLIPVITQKISSGSPVEIFGTDLPTPDGTCLRDYLDVRDIAKAHLIVANEMASKDFPKVVNLSSGTATSVKEIINVFETVLGKKVEILSREKSPADPVAVWSQESELLAKLGWKATYTLHDSIVSHLNTPL
jgi:UDP-glucose 4-epimerase